MRVRSKFWLEDDDGDTVFGQGRRRMLELIAEKGSMQAAAKELNMSYRGVWARIKATEERLGIKLIETSVGRGKKGGSRLTNEAKNLLKDFKRLNRLGIEHADALFSNIIEGKPGVPILEEPEDIEDVQHALVPALAVVGPPDSGKLELCADMAKAWAVKGRRVGVIRLGVSNAKDKVSEKLVKEGVPYVIATAPGNLHIVSDNEDLVPEMIAANYLPGCDVALVVSNQRLHLPTVEFYKKALSDKPITRRNKDLVAVVGDAIAGKPDWPRFPRKKISALIDHLENQWLPKPDHDLTAEFVELMVNGRKVPMLPFVKDIILNAVIGMVASLKSCEDPHSIKIDIRLPEK
jgi:molybdate transport system regulatory protein